jgi:hypothetical protein
VKEIWWDCVVWINLAQDINQWEFHKRWGISWPTERLSAYQEGVCSVELRNMLIVKFPCILTFHWVVIEQRRSQSSWGTRNRPMGNHRLTQCDGLIFRYRVLVFQATEAWHGAERQFGEGWEGKSEGLKGYEGWREKGMGCFNGESIVW